LARHKKIYEKGNSGELPFSFYRDWQDIIKTLFFNSKKYWQKCKTNQALYTSPNGKQVMADQYASGSRNPFP
jgi:hypothetical protein